MDKSPKTVKDTKAGCYDGETQWYFILIEVVTSNG